MCLKSGLPERPCTPGLSQRRRLAQKPRADPRARRLSRREQEPGAAGELELSGDAACAAPPFSQLAFTMIGAFSRSRNGSPRGRVKEHEMNRVGKTEHRRVYYFVSSDHGPTRVENSIRRSSSLTNRSRGQGVAPKRARWAVSCWQSIN